MFMGFSPFKKCHQHSGEEGGVRPRVAFTFLTWESSHFLKEFGSIRERSMCLNKSEPKMPLTPEPPARGAELEYRHVHRLVLPVHLRARPHATPGSKTSFTEASKPTQYNRASSVRNERTEDHFYYFCSGSEESTISGNLTWGLCQPLWGKMTV